MKVINLYIEDFNNHGTQQRGYDSTRPYQYLESDGRVSNHGEYNYDRYGDNSRYRDDRYRGNGPTAVGVSLREDTGEILSITKMNERFSASMNKTYRNDGKDLVTATFNINDLYMMVGFDGEEITYYEDNRGNWFDNKIMDTKCPFFSLVKVNDLEYDVFHDIIDFIHRNRYSNRRGYDNRLSVDLTTGNSYAHRF